MFVYVFMHIHTFFNFPLFSVFGGYFCLLSQFFRAIVFLRCLVIHACLFIFVSEDLD